MFEVKEKLSADNILLRINEESIFRYYCKPFKNIGEKFSSELREDPNPSAVISEYNDKLWYKDFGESIKPCNCFNYVMRKYSLTFMQALGVINLDFNLGLSNYVEYPPSLNYVGLPDKKIIFESSNLCSSKKVKIIIPIYRPWLETDVKFWKNRYYANIVRMESFGIRPIKGFFLDGTYIKTELHTYAFHVDTEYGIDYFKIYSPFSKQYKWISNCKNYHYLGYNQLPWIGDNLIITKSLKDIVVLSIFNLPAISPQSESQIISYEMYSKLCERFKKLYVFYDNDAAGIEGSNKTVETFKDITPIFIPKEFDVKDISDYIDRYRYVATQKLLEQLLWENTK